MSYDLTMVWTVVKRFLVGWAVAAVVLVIAACVKHWDFIAAVFMNNVWAWVNALMPAVIVIIGLGIMLKAIFK